VKKRVKKFVTISPLQFLLLREKLGFKRYRKTEKRNEEKRQILLNLYLKRIKEKEKSDFMLLGFRRRKVSVRYRQSSS
jgi:hypothetical protein